VSAKHDRTFRDSFMLVLGILLAVTLVLLGLARAISSRSLQAHRQDDPVYQRELLARIEPLAKVAVAGQDNSALEPAAAAPAAATADLGGEEVYNQACVACHGAGVAGAPKFGDKAAWAERVAAGCRHAAQARDRGLPGQGGIHAPKGGRTDLTDQSVINCRRLHGLARQVNSAARGCHARLPRITSLIAIVLGCPPPCRCATPAAGNRSRCVTPAANSRRINIRAGRRRPRRAATISRLAAPSTRTSARIATEMQRNGYEESQVNPDVRIPMRQQRPTRSRTTRCASESASAAGAGNVGGSCQRGQPSFRNFTEGTLVIHAIDAAKNSEVWQGSISGKMTKGSVEPAAIQHAVSTAMRDFPAKGGTTPQ
jgi:cytochrome c5